MGPPFFLNNWKSGDRYFWVRTPFFRFPRYFGIRILGLFLFVDFIFHRLGYSTRSFLLVMVGWIIEKFHIHSVWLQNICQNWKKMSCVLGNENLDLFVCQICYSHFKSFGAMAFGVTAVWSNGRNEPPPGNILRSRWTIHIILKARQSQYFQTHFLAHLEVYYKPLQIDQKWPTVT